jgi:hypothetical protein
MLLVIVVANVVINLWLHELLTGLGMSFVTLWWMDYILHCHYCSCH